MADQPRLSICSKQANFLRTASRPGRGRGHVARGQLRDDEQFSNGGTDTTVAAEFPWSVTIEVLHRGQERYNIYAPRATISWGSSNGMIVRRGYPPALSPH